MKRAGTSNANAETTHSRHGRDKPGHDDSLVSAAASSLSE